MKRLTAGMLALAAAGAMGAVWTAGGIAAPDKDIVIGEQCDRTGPTQLVGISLCPAILDYINLVNSNGGVEGYKIKLEEIDNEYKVPPAIEAYEKQKADGAVSIMLYGTPQTQALTKKLAEDKIRVCAIAPVATETPLLPSFLGPKPGQREKFVASVPLGRLAQVQDIANTALFLASKDAEFLTGNIVEVDGGRCV